MLNPNCTPVIVVAKNGIRKDCYCPCADESKNCNWFLKDANTPKYTAPNANEGKNRATGRAICSTRRFSDIIMFSFFLFHHCIIKLKHYPTTSNFEQRPRILTKPVQVELQLRVVTFSPLVARARASACIRVSVVYGFAMNGICIPSFSHLL
jgi:hypothetical protein